MAKFTAFLAFGPFQCIQNIFGVSTLVNEVMTKVMQRSFCYAMLCSNTDLNQLCHLSSLKNKEPRFF